MDIAAGTLIGRFEVHAPLGSGGMGKVYVARDLKLLRPVALKLLPAEIAADPQLLARFRREAQAVLALNHPHIVTVYDAGEVDGVAYLATELIDGENLRQRMAAGNLPLAELLRIGAQVAAALAAAHAEGIIHRDIKPENVMLRRDGYVKVLDFGIAKVLAGSRADASDELHVTKENTLVGTVGYMSPEQLTGENVDGRCDIWSLGVLLYEMATGRLPFRARSVNGVIANILTAALVPASEVSPPPGRAFAPVPRALDYLLGRAINRDLTQRYPRCEELLADLERLRVTVESGVEPGTRIMTAGREPTGPWIEIAEALRVAPAPAAARHNLPLPATSFHGREAELMAVIETLGRPEVRLLVLTGPGGAGKTRLSLEAAAAMVDDFPDGVWLVSLAAVSDPELVPAAIADVLGVKELGDRPSLDSLAAWLRSRQLLLVLDNLEQVVTAGPALAQLLAAAAGLKLLVTSREVLHLRGEHDMPVPPLDLPSRLPPLDELATYPAVALFLSRARALMPTFELDRNNARAVLELCRRLDGLPLAIELAAARVRLLPPPAMLRRLGDRFRLLAGGSSDIPHRHRTLRATLDWGYDLLPEGERQLFRRLSIFRDAFVVPAVLAVCCDDPAADDGEVLDLLSSLLDKSLLQRREGVDGEPRFALLETIRAYAASCVGEAEEVELRRRHARYFRDLAERGVPELAPATQRVPLAELAAAGDDLRAALQWALEQDDPEPALRLTGSLWWFWYLHGDYSEGRRWVETALARAGDLPTAARARTLLGAGKLAFLQCDYPAASQLLALSDELARALGESRVLAATLQFSGSVARERGDYARALLLHGESLELWRQLDDARGVARSLNYLAFASWLRGDLAAAALHGADTFARFGELEDSEGMAWSLLNRSAIAYYGGDMAGARAVAREALGLAGDADFKEGNAWALNLLALVALREQRPEQAQALLRRSLELHRDLGDRWRMASVLEALAAVARATGDLPHAVRLDSGAAVLRETLGTPLPPVELRDWQPERAAAAATLGEEEYSALVREGHAMALEALIELALR